MVVRQILRAFMIIGAGRRFPRLARAVRSIAQAAADWLKFSEGEGLERATLAFYRTHVAHIVARIGNQKIASLTKPGAEPHDLELTPRDVSRVAKGDLVVYLKGFQPSVDDAVRNEAQDKAFDAAKYANLDRTYKPIEGGVPSSKRAVDPHFWLDPQRLSEVTQQLSTRLAKVDPAHKQQYADNAAALVSDLAQLDSDYKAGLASCLNRDLVTSHNAFAYLAERYGMTQVGIAGLTPESEPTPADLAAVTAFVKAHDVKTIYYETLVSPAIAQTVARETGAKTEVLDPIEGLTDKSQGKDYLEVMRSNLANLKTGQPCP